MACFRNAPSMNIGQDLIDLSNHSEVLRSGSVRIRGLGRLSKRLWKKRQLTLVGNTLLVQQHQQHTYSPRFLKRIPLKSITSIERIDLTPACLALESTCGAKFYISFENDAVLYDWQDDIYPRSKLGSFSHPFNFVHEVHLTSNDFILNSSRLSALRNRMQPPKRRSSDVTSQRTSSELSHTQTHRQSFSPQRLSYDSCTKKTTSSHRRTNSASSTSTCRFVFDPSIHPTGSLASTLPTVLLEGLYQVKRYRKRTLFSFWRSYYVVLTSRGLQIRKTQTSRAEITIQLSCITDVSQLNLTSKPFVLRIGTSDNREYLISLPNTLDLEKWSRCIASRSKRPYIREPEGFEFHVHVSWDAKLQAFTGLPDEWKTSLEVHQLQEKARETPNDVPSPMAPGIENSSIKPKGPSCPMCYNSMQCCTCKFDKSNPSCSNALQHSGYDHSHRNRPFSLQSGTTLIGDHENHRC